MATKESVQEIVASALRAHSRLALRSEKLSDVRFLDISADETGLDQLDTADWQVVFGRRGTGKTHLFGCLAELKEKQFIQARELVLRFIALDFIASDERGPTDKATAHAFFCVFVEQLGRKLLDYVDICLGSPTYLDALKGNRRRRNAKLESLALELNELTAVGVESRIRSPRKATRTDQIRETTQMNRGLAASGSGGPSAATVGVSAKVDAELGYKKTRQAEVSTTGMQEVAYVRRFDLVCSKLEELLKELEIRRAILTIDEWAALEPTASLGIQAEFADLLRHTFFNSKRISVKIASNRYQTKLALSIANRGDVGLELGAEIFEAINLDHALLNEEELRSFYASLMFKRLCLSNSQVKSLGKSIDPNISDPCRAPLAALRPADGFTELIFRDDDSFIELIRGCEGIPRDFIELFNRAAVKFSYSTEEKWGRRKLQDVIRERSVALSAERLEYNSWAYRVLHSAIRPIVVETRCRTVLLDIRERDGLVPAIAERLERRMLHEYPRSHVPQSVRDAFRPYLVDHGCCLDWIRSLERDSGSRETMLRDIDWKSEKEIAQATLRLKEHNANQVTCVTCQKAFAPDAKSYVVKRLCPLCFEPT